MKVCMKVTAALFMVCFTHANSQEERNPAGEPSPKPGFSLTTTYLTFLNWGDEKTNTHHYEFHLRYALSKRTVIGAKIAAWKLFGPMGIQFWDSKFLDESEFYPGKQEERGIGLTYQHFLWKNLFASIEILPLEKRYLDEDRKLIGKGFKLYTTYHAGYRFSFLGERFQLEPQIHCNYWPIDTEGPQRFEEKSKRWANYFLFEPNLYLGVAF